MAPKKLPHGRKKAFAPKVRTGCDTCKTRRVKCDEAKPNCVRCQRSGAGCHYTSSTTPTTASQSSSIRESVQRYSPAAGLSDPLYSEEERQSLDFFVHKAAIFFSEHGPHRARDFWLVTLARAFHAMPALRHLITATCLFEMPACDTAPSAILARSHRIYYNYNLALQELTQPNPHPVDLALAPILAWTLDSICGDESRAAIHANAIEHLTLKCPSIKSSDLNLSYDILAGMVFNIRRYRRLRVLWVPPGSGTQVYRGLVVRNQCSRSSAQDTLASFEQYYQDFDPETMTPAEIASASAWIREIHIAIKATVYHVDNVLVIWGALRYLCLLSGKLVPRLDPWHTHEADDVHLGLDFILEQNEDMLKRKLPKRDDQNFLHKVIGFTLQVMQRFTPDVWRWQQREALARLRVSLRKTPVGKAQDEFWMSPQGQTEVGIARFPDEQGEALEGQEQEQEL